MNISSIPYVERQLELAFPAKKWTSVRTLVAVSGGPDSVALIRAMTAIANRMPNDAKSDLIVGHVNHGLRGSDSDADERFVQSVAQELGLRFQTSSANESVESETDEAPTEESLRDVRYEQLLELASQIGARYLVTGHHFDDQVETIVFRILRGTGVAGLAGIPRYRLANDSITIVRPLLEVRRAEIFEYLRSLDQAFCVDHSNSESVYTRNFLRNELLLELTKRFGDAIPQSLVRLGEQAKEVDDYLTDQATKIMRLAISRSGDQIEIDCEALRDQPPILIRQLMLMVWKQENWPRQAMTHQWWQKICVAIQGNQDVVLNLPGPIRFEKTASTARLIEGRLNPELE